MLMSTLLIVGCIFPVIVWLTFVGGYINRKVNGKPASAVLIPFIGPVFINIWSFEMSHPSWAYVIPWVVDIATISFLIFLPKLLNELWEFSRFTELLSLNAEFGNKTANLILHKGNKYIIRFNWFRHEGEQGILAANDFGSYQADGDTKYILTSHTGNIRILERTGGVYRCTDILSASNTNVDGYEFT